MDPKEQGEADPGTKAANSLSKIAGGAVGTAALPTAVSSIVASFGTASTGTAISTLHGAALTSATVAAIGFGSMAAGTVVLATLGVAGWWIGRKACARLGGKVLDRARNAKDAV